MKKKLVCCISAFAAAGAVLATDYFCTTASTDKASCSAPFAVWAAVDQSTPSALIAPSANTAGDDFWIIDNLTAGEYTAGTVYIRRNDSSLLNKGTFNLGSPADKVAFPSRFGIIQHNEYANAGFEATLNWYNGKLNNRQGKYSITFSGTYYLTGDAATHDIVNSHADRLTEIAATLVSDSPGINIDMRCENSCALDSTGYVYLHPTAGNQGYKGTFSLSTAYLPLYLSGTEPLGDPSTPNPAALTVCENGCFGLAGSATVQSSGRGIRLLGDTAYYRGAADGLTLGYPISKGEGVAGKLVKVDAEAVTFDAPYTAGDIEIRAGKLVLGSNATVPDGLNIKVCDGAELLSYIKLTACNVTTEGSGKWGYRDGWRVNGEGKWEVRVSATAAGEGSVSPSEKWVCPGEVVELVATPNEGMNFLQWTGDFSALVGRMPFSPTVTVRADAPVALTAKFGMVTVPENVTCADGTTLTFADRVLTVAVPNGVTTAYDYSQAVMAGLVTNIVKTGLGAFTPPPMADYVGDFDLREGTWNSSSAGEFGSDGIGVIRYRPGVTNVINSKSSVATGKRVFAAGTFYGPTVSSKSDGFLRACEVTFVGDVLAYQPTSQGALLFRGSTVDVAGHGLSFATTDSYRYFYLSGIAFTNSSATAVTIVPPRPYHTLFVDEGTSFRGGAANVLKYQFDTRIRLYEVGESDWTFEANELCMLDGPNNNTVNVTKGRWTGPVALTYTGGMYGNIRLNQNFNDSCLTFSGPISGGGRVDILGGVLNILSAENTFSGSMAITNKTSVNLRSLIKVWDGAKFSLGTGKPLQIANADFEIGESTAYALPSFKVVAGTSTFRGGPSSDRPCGRATLEDFTTGGTSLTIDSPVVLKGTTAINAGTLALSAKPKTEAELPVFSNLVFAAGTAFDLKGNDLTVPNLTGFPTLLNAGTLTIAGTWTVDYADLVRGKALDLGTGSMVFAEGAKIVVTGRTGSTTEELVPVRAANVSGAPVLVGWRRQVVLEDGRLVLKPLGLTVFVR